MKLCGHVISRVMLTIAILTITGCVTTMQLQSPLPLKQVASKRNVPISIYIPKESKEYIHKVNHFEVKFGESLDSTIQTALKHSFNEVINLTQFPPVASTTSAVAVTFGSVEVLPGAFTFSDSTARVKLDVRMLVQPNKKPVSTYFVGEATVSPGVEGALPIIGLNDSAYNAAVQKACELALTRAIESLVSDMATTFHASKT